MSLPTGAAHALSLLCLRTMQLASCNQVSVVCCWQLMFPATDIFWQLTGFCLRCMPDVLCAALVAGFMVAGQTPGADTSGSNLAPQGPADTPPATTDCPIGYYYDGNSTNVFACIKCPTGSTTRRNGSTSLDECVVPPGYWLSTVNNTLVKCPGDVNGTGYYRSNWVSFKFAQDTDGTTACSRCGTRIKSVPRDSDERTDLPADDGSDLFYDLVAASPQSCYIEAGWGITLDPANLTQFRAIAPCPENTYGEICSEQCNK
jgi:hypothetical protein